MNADLDAELDLAEQLLILLREEVQGCSEYQLIQLLKTRHSTHIPHRPLTDRLVLFRSHFLVFNALYRLRDRLWSEQVGHLQINALHVQLLPYQAGNAAVSEHDSLRDYYLDLDNLRDTQEEDVEKLLTSFWKRMQGGDEKQAALQLLGLDTSREILNRATIKRRYRELVSEHHPDRGGSTERLQSLNLAIEILERYY
ncbi:molecular chaperone DnaJ [Pseudomonas sp. LS44]|uniref:DNA-J related domain-containing protein n=1 Tax=Pseudomonas sp. LS44 TaxID=1357074 RepID=UPI00215B5942|nr:DNA-J related domain-containing protein [Pseudomonas sp. LS44]UVE16547.1 molecular chaperone DnaJ [Pseudomonas sp. LS44]